MRVVVISLAVVVAASVGPGGSRAGAATVPDPCSAITDRITTSYRWKDIAENAYAQSYKDTYDYADAVVVFDYDSPAESTLSGHFSATNLKPNFAYQLKLTGKPEALWGESGDDATNERLGYLGRWWRLQPDPGNTDDADYEAHHDDPGYMFEGYLLFHFLVTDSVGNVESDIAVDSSYHVLWWEDQRIREICDSPVRWSTVIGHAVHPAYAEDVGPTTVGVYAEIERNCTGTTTMPAGLYDCCLVLTEESFHQSGEDDGNWQSVTIDDGMRFEIAEATVVQDGTTLPGAALRGAVPNPFNPRTAIRFDIPRDDHVALRIYDVRGSLVRVLVDGTLPGGSHRATWDGRDASGRAVASGSYFARLEAQGKVETVMMSLVR